MQALCFLCLLLFKLSCSPGGFHVLGWQLDDRAAGNFQREVALGRIAAGVGDGDGFDFRGFADVSAVWRLGDLEMGEARQV